MKTEEIDKRIGMPDIDQEWAKFEQEVITPTHPAKKLTLFKSFTTKAAAIAGLIFCISLAGIGHRHQEQQPATRGQV